MTFSPTRLSFLFALPLLFIPCLAFGEGGEVRVETSDGIRTIAVAVASTPEERAKGLMFHESIDLSSGMYFTFERKAPQIFWMKNVPFALDILFIGSDGTIVSMVKNAPPCATMPCPLYHSGYPIIAALELMGGWCDKYGVRVGGKVEYLP